MFIAGVACIQLLRQFSPTRVVDVDHRSLQIRPIEQSLFSLPVTVHVAVVVQVVLREVGEYRQPDVRARHTVFGQPNRRSLYRTNATARIHKTA